MRVQATRVFLPVVLLVVVALLAMLALMWAPGRAEAAVSVSNPRVVEDPSMASGQKATWDCVWFGSYPQTEVKQSDAAYSRLVGASWNASGDATVDGVRYRRISRDDEVATVYGSDWSSSDPTWRYFRYEPIKWRVLKVQGNRALVVSDTALDDRCYHEKHTHVTWSTSTMRSWLNGYGASSNERGIDYTSRNFLSTAFSASELPAVLPTPVANDDNPNYGTEGGPDTSDRVFLLSIAEATNPAFGFVGSEERRCGATGFARAIGTYVYVEGDDAGYCWWWLRTSGFREERAAIVELTGNVLPRGARVNDTTVAVRPAMWVSV